MQILRSDVSRKCHSRKAHGCSTAVHHKLECCFQPSALLRSELSTGKSCRSLIGRRKRRGVSALPLVLLLPLHTCVHTQRTDTNCAVTRWQPVSNGREQPRTSARCSLPLWCLLSLGLIKLSFPVWFKSKCSLSALTKYMGRTTAKCILVCSARFLLRKRNTAEAYKLTTFSALGCQADG